MNKITVPSLMLMLMGFFASNVHAELVWTTGSCAPSEWTALSDNILLNVVGTSAASGVKDYASLDLAVLTDGKVPQTTPDKDGIFGFRKDENISWMFDSPMTIDQIKVSSCYLGGAAYDGVHIAKVEAIFFGGSDWVQIAGDFEYKGGSTSGSINYIVLRNGDDPVAENILGLKITFGACETGFANYYAEIEAVGRAGEVGPTIGSVDVTPAKTKAIFSGSIADAGTDATMCNVHLSINGATPVRIAKRVTDTFEYCLEGLESGTTYSYTLSVSNNAPAVKGTSRSGTFTTLAIGDLTTVWTVSDVVPETWTALSSTNLLAGIAAEVKGPIATSFSSDKPGILTDGFVPVGGGIEYRVGFQQNSYIEWVFDKPMSFGQLRVSACYLDDYIFTRLAIGAVSVKIAGSDTWEKFDAEVLSDIGGRYGKKVVLCATLSDIEKGYLAKNVVALKIDFGNVGALASYVVEVEAAGIKKPQKKPGFSVIVR